MGIFYSCEQGYKKLYAAAALLDAIPYSTMDTIKRLLVKEWTCVDITEFEYDAGYHTLTIDHQSRPLIPYDYDGNINEQFFKEYFDYLQQDNLVILGGNDNDDKPHPLSDNKSADLPLHKEQDNSSWIARKDQKFDYWVLYNKVNGTKIRFRFGPGDPPAKAWAPELVDMKITDFCNMGCQFCYQSSTPNGKHGDYEYISSIFI